MHNSRHSVTYKYKNTTRYKIQYNPKIQDKIHSRTDEAEKLKTMRGHSPKSSENTVNPKIPKHVHTRADNTHIITRRESVLWREKIKREGLRERRERARKRKKRESFHERERGRLREKKRGEWWLAMAS